MPRFSPLVVLICLAPFVAAEPKIDSKTQRIQQVRELETAIEKARGLKFKKPVVVNVIPRGKDTPAGVQAYYDHKKKEVFLYEDIKGSYAKGVLIHELVHALQDQHFNLTKLHQDVFESDRELAIAALIEGDATLVSIEMLQKEQPHMAKMLETQLEKAKNLQNAFLYGVGARWVKAIKDKGGWEAVNRRYQFLPMSTATVLHPEEFILPVRLGPGRTIGEFGLIKLFHENQATKARCVELAKGWRGDRLIREGEATGWVVEFVNEQRASAFREALQEVRQSQASKASITQQGKFVYEVVAPSEKDARQLRERLEGKPLLSVYSALDKKEISFGELIDRLAAAQIVCIGEQHDSRMDHTIQRMIIQALHAREEQLGVGLEMFQRPFQKVLDRYVAGEISEKVFLEDTEYQKRWGYDWNLYAPIVRYCQRNRVALAGLNLSNELRGRLSKEGYAKLTPEEKQQIGEVDFNVKAHRDYHFESLGSMHGHGPVPEDQKERMYQVMTTWDEYMADSAVKFLKERNLNQLVILAGSGHIDRYFGIPDRVKKRLPGGTVRTVRIVTSGDTQAAKDEPQADFVLLAR
ncbi:MAG: ChaN family lipoprotein [Gemmataceae bacterium]